MEQPIIEIDHVSMRFNAAKEKVDSLKEFFIRKAKGKMHFEEFYALSDISLRVMPGDVYGIVGLNGSGKSTLLKVVAGVMKPSAGTCVVRGKVAPLIELGAGFDMELTGRENVFLNGTLLGMHPNYLKEKYQEIVDFAEIGDFMDVPVKNYSSGMVTRLAFSVATITKPDILICDEILSVGDFLFQQKSEKRMKELMSGGTTVLLVSHNIDQIERLCSKAMWLRKGKTVINGSCAEVCDAYKEQG
ncbi:MAG: ABC transporter ATP-binding protein [Oscillospiraceae bacterium]